MTANEIRRDGRGRPYILPPGETDEKTYTRSSKLSSALDDSYGLDLWHQRNLAIGITDNRWLLEEISENRHSAKELDSLCSIARECAGESEKSSWGTVVHWFTECIDAGVEWTNVVPPDDVEAAAKSLGKSLEEIAWEAQDDLHAYEFAMAAERIVSHEIERFVVQDDVRAAGTLDRIYEYNGKFYIGDLKTSSSDLKLQWLKWAMQLAIYARSKFYDPEFPEAREPLPELDLERALVIHLPKEQGECTAYWVPIDKGWEAVQFARELEELRRKARKWGRDVRLPDPVPVPPLPLGVTKVAELREFAKKYKIPLSGATKKADIEAAVIAAEGEVFE